MNINEMVKVMIQALPWLQKQQEQQEALRTTINEFGDSPHSGSNNHNRKSSKVRRLMAKNSRRINRGKK